MDRPGGDIDITSFGKRAHGDVGPMAVTNVTIDQAAAFADCAAQGGLGIQAVVQGPGMEVKFDLPTFVQALTDVWFAEDWPPLMNSPFVKCSANIASAGDLDTYQNDLQRLVAACILPTQGLTLAVAICNFHIAELVVTNSETEQFASFSTGHVCVCNQRTFPSRLQWSGFQTEIVQDASPHIVGGHSWNAHNVTIL